MSMPISSRPVGAILTTKLVTSSSLPKISSRSKQDQRLSMGRLGAVTSSVCRSSAQKVRNNQECSGANAYSEYSGLFECVSEEIIGHIIAIKKYYNQFVSLGENNRE